MNPQQQNYNLQDQSPSDYLDQIAPKNTNQNFITKLLNGDKKRLAIVGGGVLFFLIIIIAIASQSGGGGDDTQKLALLNTRYTNFIAVVNYGSENISNNSTLTQINAQIDIVAKSQSATIASYLPAKYKLDKNVAATETYSAETIKTLDTANTSGKLTATYKRTLAEKLNNLIDGVSSILTVNSLTKQQKATFTEYLDQLNTLKDRLKNAS